MGELSDKQAQFTFMTAQLIDFAFKSGFRLRYLCAKCAKPGHHMNNSLHYDGLAVDFALDIRDVSGNWTYSTRTQDYCLCGQFWESIGGSWGGRFGESAPGAADGTDGNHFSLEDGGRR